MIRIDHLVLTVASIDASCDFYVKVLGMKVEICAEGSKALVFGVQKINLHQKGREFEPRPAIRRRVPPTFASSPRRRSRMSSPISLLPELRLKKRL